jgi:hypothetical protein
MAYDAGVSVVTVKPRVWLIALGAVVLLVVSEIAFSLRWPEAFPRVALLPRPAETVRFDGCNWHYRGYERRGVVWVLGDEISTLRAC